MEITYEKLKSIIVSESVDGQMVNVSFHAEGLSAPIQTMGYIMPDQDEIMKNVAKMAAMNAGKSAAISGAASLLGNAIGGVGGSVARNAASTAGHELTSGMGQVDVTKTDITPEKVQQAIVQAFQGVMMYFQWDDASQSWKGVQPG